MKKWIAVLVIAMLIGAGVAVYFSSNLSRSTASAKFYPDPDRPNMNTLEVEAPYGYYVIQFSVVPRSPAKPGEPYMLGGYGIAQDPIGLFDTDTSLSTDYPSRGGVADVPLEQHVRIASDLNLSATAELPTDPAVLDRCGQYVIITRDRSQVDQLESVVSGGRRIALTNGLPRVALTSSSLSVNQRKKLRTDNLLVVSGTH